MRRTRFTLYRDEFGRDVQCAVLSIGSGAPHVVLIALQHGDEILGLETGLQVMQRCAQARIHGTITLLTCLNPIGFRDGRRSLLATSYELSGLRTNMNRVHPGNDTGSLAERIAFAVDRFIIKLQPDYVVDLHAYASQSVPHIILDPVSGQLEKTMVGWTEASGVPYYREYAAEAYAAHGMAGCLSMVWCQRDVPAITLELGPITGFDREDRAAAESALCSVLHAVGVIQEAVEPSEAMRTMQQRLAGQTWQRTDIVNDTSATGFCPSFGINRHSGSMR